MVLFTKGMSMKSTGLEQKNNQGYESEEAERSSQKKKKMWKWRTRGKNKSCWPCSRSEVYNTNCTEQAASLRILGALKNRMYLWWSLCTLYLHACQVRVTVGSSGLRCCICVMYIECKFNSLLCWFCTSGLGLFLFQIFDQSLILFLVYADLTQ